MNMPYLTCDRYAAIAALKNRFGQYGYAPDVGTLTDKQIEFIVGIFVEILPSLHILESIAPLPPVTAEQVLELFMKRLVDRDLTGT